MVGGRTTSTGVSESTSYVSKTLKKLRWMLVPVPPQESSAELPAVLISFRNSDLPLFANFC